MNATTGWRRATSAGGRRSCAERGRAARPARAVVAAPARSVLDVGVGTGNLALAALDAGRTCRITGIDASREMLGGRRIADGRWRRPAAARDPVAFAAELPIADGRFDVAMSSFVLQLVPNRAKVLREIRRVLRPGGTLGYVTWLDGPAPFAPDRDLRRAPRRVRLRRRAGRRPARRHPVRRGRRRRAAARRLPGGRRRSGRAGLRLHGRVVHRLPDRIRRGDPVRRDAPPRAPPVPGDAARAPDGPAGGRPRPSGRRSSTRPGSAPTAEPAGGSPRRASAVAGATLGRWYRRRPRPRRPLALGAFLALGDDRDLLDLDARRLDLGDDLVAVGQQGDVGRDRRGRGRGSSRRSRPATRSSTRSTAAGGPAGALTLTVSVGCRSVPPSWRDGERLADRRRAARRRSAPRSSGRGTGRRGAGRRLTGWTWTLLIRTGCAFLPSTDRSTRAFGPVCRRSRSKSWVSTVTLVESSPWP